MINKQPAVDAQGTVYGMALGSPDLPVSSTGRWGGGFLGDDLLHSIFVEEVFRVGLEWITGDKSDDGSALMHLGAVHRHVRVIENARTLSPPLIKLPSTFRADLSLGSEYHFPHF